MLTTFRGGEDVAGRKLKSTEPWVEDAESSGNETNESGFDGVLGGGRYAHGDFSVMGENAGWWTSTEESGASARIRGLTHHQNGIDNYPLP